MRLVQSTWPRGSEEQVKHQIVGLHCTKREEHLFSGEGKKSCIGELTVACGSLSLQAFCRGSVDWTQP